MRNTLKLVICIAVIAIAISSAIIPAYASSSSSVEFSGDVTTEKVYINIYDGDGNAKVGSIIDSDAVIKCTSSSGSYIFLEGTVSTGLHLRIVGSGYYVLAVEIIGGSSFLKTVNVTLAGYSLPVSVSNGNGSYILGNHAFTEGSDIALTVSVAGCTGNTTDLTLGNIRFTAIYIGTTDTTSTKAYSEDISGASVLDGSNSITTKLKSITKSSDVVEYIEEANDEKHDYVVGENGTYYYIRTTDDISDYNAALISFSTDVNEEDIAEDGNHDFTVPVNIPAGVKVCIQVIYRGGAGNNNVKMTVTGATGLTTNSTEIKLTGLVDLNVHTYYMYNKNGNITNSETNTVPDESKWIDSGEDGIQLTFTGSKNAGKISGIKILDCPLEVRILMKNA